MPRTKASKGRKSPMVMHKAEKERELRARLKWLLDFLNQDLDLLKPTKCLYLVLDLVMIFIYWEEGAPVPLLNRTLSELKGELFEQKKVLNLCQDYLRGLLERILMTEEHINVRLKPTVSLGTYNTYYRVLVNKDRVSKSPVFRPLTPQYLDKKEGIEGLYKGLLTDALIETLSRFPLSRIRTCQKPDCGNYFYQKTTKSKGDFCSRKCQNWANTNRWRKANPDKYNAYHRNRRARLKEDQIGIKCPSCGFQQSIGSFKDLMQGILSDMKKCPACGAVLLHSIWAWENGKLIEGEHLGSFEWEEFWGELKKKKPK